VATVCCDTSFLVSLYGQDIHTPRAEAALRKLNNPLQVSPLNEFEFGNALQLLVFRKLTRPPEAAAIAALFQADIAEGRVVSNPCNLASAIVEAKRITAFRTASGGHRAFDVLHVAAALQMEATLFLSFDANQRKLAEKEGLAVGP